MKDSPSLSPRIEFLYTNIGRGHPFYLDGIIEALVRKGEIGLVRGEDDVFSVSSGLSRMAWSMVRRLYYIGSSGGVGSRLYTRLRRVADYNRPGAMLRLLGRSIVRSYMERPWPVVVAHPILVAILKGRHGLIYQHGELAAPAEALVEGATKVLVPTEETAHAFTEFGYDSDDVLVTGLCIEPSLVRQAESGFEIRQARLRTTAHRTGAFFSSGAEPKSHVVKLNLAIESAVSAGGHAIVFTQLGGRLERACLDRCRRRNIGYAVLDSRAPVMVEPDQISVVTFDSRRELAHRTAQLFPFFDYFVAPAHERSNWAMGLGLPMFIVGPDIGSFAPLNRQRLLVAGVARPLDSIDSVVELAPLIAGDKGADSLFEMARSGWGRLPIDGFARAAEFLSQRFASKP